MIDSRENKNNEKNAAAANATSSENTKNSADNQKSSLGDKISDAVHGDTKAAKDIINQAKESTGEVAGKAYDAAAKTANSKIDEQKASLAAGLSSVADNIRQMGDNLRDGESPQGIATLTADYTSTLADKVEQVSTYLDQKKLSELMKDVESFAHRNPALFISGAFVLGVAAARFLKSGKSNQASSRRPSYERKGEHEGVHLPKDLEQQVKKESADATDKSVSAASSNKGA